MSQRRNGLRKQVTEEKEGPLDLRRKREARKTCLEQEGGERLQPERVRKRRDGVGRGACTKCFYLEALGMKGRN